MEKPEDIKVEKIVDFHIKRGRERAIVEEGKEKQHAALMFHVNHRRRCVCYAPRMPLYSSLWPLYGQRRPHEPKVPKRHDHRLFALTGIWNFSEFRWKTIEILECDFATKAWNQLAAMPYDFLRAHFNVSDWDVMNAHSFEGRIFICRKDAWLQGAIYDIDKKTWDLDWRFPIQPGAVAWFSAIPPVDQQLDRVPWEKHLKHCFTQI